MAPEEIHKLVSSQFFLTVLSDVGLVHSTRLVDQVIGTEGSWVRLGFKMDVSQNSCRDVCPTTPSAHVDPHIRDPQGCDGIVHVNLQRRHLAAAERRAVVARVVQEEVKQVPANRFRQLTEPPARCGQPGPGAPPRVALSDASNRLATAATGTAGPNIKI